MNAATYNAEKKVWVIEEVEREWYSVQDVSRITGQGGPSTYAAIKRGILVGYIVSGNTRIKHEDLVNYVNRRGETKVMTNATDELIKKILPDPTNGHKATKLAQDVALERPALNLDLFNDEDEDEDEDVFEDAVVVVTDEDEELDSE